MTFKPNMQKDITDIGFENPFRVQRWGRETGKFEVDCGLDHLPSSPCWASTRGTGGRKRRKTPSILRPHRCTRLGRFLPKAVRVLWWLILPSSFALAQGLLKGGRWVRGRRGSSRFDLAIVFCAGLELTSEVKWAEFWGKRCVGYSKEFGGVLSRVLTRSAWHLRCFACDVLQRRKKINRIMTTALVDPFKKACISRFWNVCTLCTQPLDLSNGNLIVPPFIINHYRTIFNICFIEIRIY